MSEDQNKIIRASRKIGSSHSAGEGVEPCGAEHPLAGVNEVKDRAEQVQVVAGDPPAKVAAAAVLNIPSLQQNASPPPVLVLVPLLSHINHQRVIILIVLLCLMPETL